MNEISRRACLKLSATAAVGMVTAACSAESQDVSGELVGGRSALNDKSYETGSMPIDLSGWVDPLQPFPDYPALHRDVSTDIAVIGAGLAGSSLALHLAEMGASVAVLEAHQPGWGASGRNAGHVLPTLKDRALIKQLPSGGKPFLDIFHEHHTIPFDLSKKHGFDCDAAQTGYLNAMTCGRAFQSYKQESQYWQKQGQEVEWLDAADMERKTGSRYYSYGVLYKSGGRVNPYQFSNGMIATAIRFGAMVFGDSEALTLEKLDKRWRVRTERGSVTADCVVFCTNAYSTAIVPEFSNNFYPLTAYALSTKPLPAEAAELIMPSRATMAQVPIDLNPLVIDRHNRIITSSIPSTLDPEKAERYFKNHLVWIHRTWPESRQFKIELEHYWTGRVALRNREFPGVFQLNRGLFGLMHFNAWGNVMAPLLGKLLAESLMSDQLGRLPFPLEKPEPVANMNKQDLIIRKLLIPAARLAQKVGIL